MLCFFALLALLRQPPAAPETSQAAAPPATAAADTLRDGVVFVEPASTDLDEPAGTTSNIPFQDYIIYVHDQRPAGEEKKASRLVTIQPPAAAEDGVARVVEVRRAAGGAARVVAAQPPAAGEIKVRGFVAVQPPVAGAVSGEARQDFVMVQDQRAAYDERTRQLLEAYTRVIGEYPWEIGVLVAPVEETLQAQLSLPKDRGVVVLRVFPNSPALEAGVQANDIIIAADDIPIGKRQDLIAISKKTKSGPMVLGLVRSGKPAKATVVLKEKAGLNAEARLGELQFSAEPTPWIGVATAKPSDPLRAQLNLPEGVGLVVTSVVPESPASTADVHVNDILISMAQKKLADIDTLVSAVRANVDKSVPLELVRGGKTMTIAVKPLKRLQDEARWRIGFNTPGQNIPILPPTAAGTLGLLVNPAVQHQPAANPHASVEAKLDQLSKQMRDLQNSMNELKQSIKHDK